MAEKTITGLLCLTTFFCPTLAISSVWPSMEKAINATINQMYCESVQGRCR
jgi:hypothetical protein